MEYINYNVTLKNNYKVNNSTLDFNINMNLDENYEFTFVISNDSKYNAYLNNMYLTNIKDVVVGVSNITGITYFLNDYIDINLKYVDDINRELMIGDTLKRNSSLDVLVSIKVKELDEDKISIINDNNLKFDYSINLDYQQKM